MTETSKVTHTPGPWRIAENEWNLKNPPWTGAIAIEAIGGDNADLAVPPILLYTTRGGEEKANARLICIAPDLLSAARVFLEPYKDVSDATLKSIAGTSVTAMMEACIHREGNFEGTYPMSPHQAASLLAFRKIIEQAGGKS